MKRLRKPRGRRVNGYQTLLQVLRFDAQGLMPTVIQDVKTQVVLTLCYLNRAALKKSLETGTVYLFRRSQNRLMQKGEMSGHIQVIKRVAVDCEGKSLVLLVQQHVAGCHQGYLSCYFRELTSSGALKIRARRLFDPRRVYRR